jgi:hypothetical protein
VIFLICSVPSPFIAPLSFSLPRSHLFLAWFCFTAPDFSRSDEGLTATLDFTSLCPSLCLCWLSRQP